MSIFHKIITLSKEIANSLIKNEQPSTLEESDLFNEEDKKHILKNLTDKSIIEERLELKSKIITQNDWLKVKPKQPTRKMYWQYAAAAVVIGILSTTYFIKENTLNNNVINSNIVNSHIPLGTDKATLTLENGETIALTKGKKYQTKNAKSNGNKIVYQEKVQNKKQIAYNFLTVPRGGQYQISLADGTEVWLNSESQLKYPVSFTEGKTRQVELVYGEAYFDVSPSSNHNGATFQVINRKQNIEVLGTEFNIKSYKNETNIYTTLVEGKVLVSYENTKQNLRPNQQSNLNLETNKLTVINIDVYNEIAWKEGIFSFENKPLKDIMTVLSRWYDIEVTFESSELEDKKFIGLLKKNYTIESILSIMQETNIINSFEIKNKSILLK